MKKLLFPLAILFSVICFANNPIPAINEKVLKAFNESFGDVKNVSWYESGKIISARFNCNGIDTQIRYDKNGNVLQTIRYYTEKELPPFIQTKVKEQYKDKEIFGITELSSGSYLFYYVVLHDDKNWLNVQADPYGNLTLYSKMKKG